MKTLLTVIGAINISFGIIGLFLAAVIFLLTSGIFPIYFGDFPAETVGIIVGSLFTVFSIIFIITGIGILKEASWARIIALITAGMSLFCPPWGTAWGIYTIIILVKQETVEIFSKQESAEEEPEKKVIEKKRGRTTCSHTHKPV